MMHRRKILAVLAIIALPVVAYGQPMPPPPGGPPPGGPPPGRPPMPPPRPETPPRRPRGAHPCAGREVAGTGMVGAGPGFRVDGGGSSSSAIGTDISIGDLLPFGITGTAVATTGPA